MRKVILLICIVCFVFKFSFAQDLVGRTIISSPYSDYFTFISDKKLIWGDVQRDANKIDGGVYVKKIIKYDYSNHLLRITIVWEKDNFKEAYTYYLEYDEENHYFVDKIYGDIWYFEEEKK